MWGPVAEHNYRCELAPEARPADLSAYAADQVVYELLRHVLNLGRQVVDLGREVVVQPHRRDGDHEAEGRRDERLGDAGRDRAEARRAGRRHGAEGVDDAHRRAEQADERGRRADRREEREAALELRDHHDHLALDRALGRVDVGHRHRAVHDERLHFLQGAAEDAGDVRALVALGQLDRLAEVVLLEELRELGRELARLRLRLAKAPPLADGDGQRPDRLDREDHPDDLREDGHRGPQLCKGMLTHGVLLAGTALRGGVDYLPIANANACWTSCFTFCPPTSAGWKRMRGSAFFTAVENRSWLDSMTLNVLTSARPSVPTTNCAMTWPATPCDCSMLGYVGVTLLSGATGFSTWNSKKVCPASTTGAGGAPSTPFAVPPATPLPEKSASLIALALRSIFGMTCGMLTGGGSVWKPFGGGGAATTSGGGGGAGVGSGSGGGGSSFGVP